MNAPHDRALACAVGLLFGLLFGALIAVHAHAAPRAAFALQGEGGRVAQVIVVFEDGSQQVLSAGGVATATVQPTHTPTPSATATSVPPATVTPPSTNTPHPTPTQESTVIPTVPPSPMPSACQIGIATSTLNVRPAPQVLTSVLAQVHSPEKYDVLAVTFADGANGYVNEWVKINAGGVVGWIAAYYQGGALAVYVDPDLCLDVRFPTALGVWVGPGANRDELIQFGRSLKAAGITPAATILGDNYTANLLHMEGWITVARPFLGDCPPWNPDARASARAWVDLALDNLSGVTYTWISLTNECTWANAQYAAAWITAAVERCAERGVARVIPVVWNSGSPELDWMKTLAPAYLDTPIPVSFGLNVYPVDDLPLSSRAGIAPWTTWRYEQLRAWIPGVPIIVTEAARADGTQAADLADIAQWVDSTRGDFAAASLWYVSGGGGLGHWLSANLAGRLAELALALF